MTTSSEEHAYLKLVPRKTGSRIVRDVALALMNHYNKQSLSRAKWLKQSPRVVVWAKTTNDGSGKQVQEWTTSLPLDLRSIENHLEGGAFDFAQFNLFEPMCDWLDQTISIGTNFHLISNDGIALTIQTPTMLGPKFPLIPRLDREGMTFMSFQTQLQRRIVKLWQSIVSASASFRNEEWFDNLRSLVGECVALIDSTLHQLYFKAQYSPLPGWRFEPEKLGSRHGRRLKDKLSWVFKVTGNPLHLSDEERASFDRIKALRNHLSHFDPPCFCYTLEDVASWLNDVSAVARINWKIREAIAGALTPSLISMLLLPEVIFSPLHQSPRLPQPANVGYGSSSWVTADDP